MRRGHKITRGAYKLSNKKGSKYKRAYTIQNSGDEKSWIFIVLGYKINRIKIRYTTKIS
jgi:hypothetical protein